MARVQNATHADAIVTDRFYRVIGFLEPPAALSARGWSLGSSGPEGGPDRPELGGGRIGSSPSGPAGLSFRSLRAER